MSGSKVADLAGPGIGNYEELEKILPNDYSSALTRRETQKAIFAVKRFIVMRIGCPHASGMISISVCHSERSPRCEESLLPSES